MGLSINVQEIADKWYPIFIDHTLTMDEAGQFLDECVSDEVANIVMAIIYQKVMEEEL